MSAWSLSAQDNATLAPIIVTQPEPLDTAAGSRAGFVVVVRGPQPLAYQWFHNGTALPGATDDLLLRPDATAAMNGDYTVRVSNAHGSVLSSAARLNVVVPALSTLDPAFAFREPRVSDITAMVPTADGKLLVAALQAPAVGAQPVQVVLRLNADGSRDAAFATAAQNLDFAVRDLVALPDGRALAFGIGASALYSSRAHAALLNANGARDPVWMPDHFREGFGVGGTFLGWFGGRIYFRRSTGAFPFEQVVRRLNADGREETDFQPEVVRVAGEELVPGAVAFDPAARVYVAASSTPNVEATLWRLLPDGSRDAAFPLVRIPRTVGTLPTQIVVAQDGTIHVGLAGQGVVSFTHIIFKTFGLAAYTPAGLPKPGFEVLTATASDETRFALLPDGGLFLAGSLRQAHGFRVNGLVRLNADGSVNPNFSTDHAATMTPRAAPVVSSDGSRVVVAEPQRITRYRLEAGLALLPPKVLRVSPLSGTFPEHSRLEIEVIAVGAGPIQFSVGRISTGTLSTGPNSVGSGDRVVIADVGRAPPPNSAPGEWRLTVTNPFGEMRVPLAFTIVPGPPVIHQQPQSARVSVGGSVAFAVSSSSGASYTWLRNGVALAGQTGGVLVLRNVVAADAGEYQVRATNAHGTTASELARLRVGPTSRLANLSARAFAGAGDQTLIVGFTVRDGVTKDLVLRAVGPELGSFGVSGVLADPSIEIYAAQAPNRLVSGNDNGSAGNSAAFERVGAFPLPTGSRSAAIVTGSSSPDARTLVVRGADGGAGVALTEIYEANQDGARLVNLSARAFVGTGTQAAIVGFAIVGDAPCRVLLRAAGPALRELGVGGALADPQMRVVDASGAAVVANDDWHTSQGSEVAATAVRAGAFPFATPSKDAALLLELSPGNYTAVVEGVGQSTGIALLELYEVP